MGRITRASIINSNKTKNIAKRVLLEVNSALGRQSISLDLNTAHEINNKKRIELFLKSNGYESTPVDKFIRLVKSRYKAQGSPSLLRVEHLGIERDKLLKLPQIGQSHELEFGALRAKIPEQDTIGHAVDFFESSNKLNGVCALKIVSETLGKTSPNATTEIVLGPAATKSQYVGVLSAVDKFRKLITTSDDFQAQNISEIMTQVDLGDEKIIPKSPTQGVIWNLDPNYSRKPCVHTSRGAPIRAISEILEDSESGLFHAPRKILEYSKAKTDEFIATTGLRAPRGGKLWETINLSIWMAACEGVVQPLMQNDLNKIYAANKTLYSWTLYAGKNFFGTLPRFSAGDLLRTGGLQARDEKQLHDLFASENLEHNKKNINLLVQLALSATQDFLSNINNIGNTDEKEVVKVLHENWHDVESWVRRDLSSDFVPRVNKKRYPEDTSDHYGNKVITSASSPSFAGSQYLPRRERLSSEQPGNAPVSGAFEFRGGAFNGNKKISEHFSAETPKRKQEALDSSWASFENYVGRLSKKQRV